MLKIQSNLCESVFWIPRGTFIENITSDGGWYYYDEVGLIGKGCPYPTEQMAFNEFNTYIKWLTEKENKEEKELNINEEYSYAVWREAYRITWVTLHRERKRHKREIKELNEQIKDLMEKYVK